METISSSFGIHGSAAYATLWFLLSGPLLLAQDTRLIELRINADQPGFPLSPLLYGLMTEEINYSYDGGIYAELIRNRSMKENPTEPVHWQLVQQNGGTGSIALDPWSLTLRMRWTKLNM